ncbi:MAG TPA: TonB-dependent receptor [Candidatus Acidoferrales bacterium]|nr:TonB-dependent receptor [Candidatus Acidoferrales bacterium]
MLRNLVVVCLFILSFAIATCAQGSGAITGKAVDDTGAAIPRAIVSVTDLTTGAVLHATTDASGEFSVSGLSSDPQLVTIGKSGFESFTQRVSFATQQSVTVNATLSVATLAETVVVRGTVEPGARPMPTRDDVQNSLQTIRVLDRKQLDAAGPVAGGAQMIALTPGANVFGYGVSGATKYTIQLNGINQGWGGQPTGFISPGSLGITFDGIPIVDVGSGLWQSATMPQNLLMQNVDVTYGPGASADRFYDDVGGSVEFTPIQPTVEHHFSVAATYGMYGQKNLAFVGNTGNFHGWSTVVGGGIGDGNDYRSAPDGFNMFGKSGSAFGKTIRQFSAGSFEFGAFYAKAGGYRPPTIPLTDQGVILTRPDGSNYSYSQSTCGFYCAPTFDEYNKYDTNEMGLIYARENLLLNNTTSVQNSTWFMHIRRLHHRTDDIFSLGPQEDEWNNPHSDAFGDKVGLQKVLPYNTLNFGAYLIHEVYNSRNLFFNSGQGGDGATETVNIGAKFRSGYFQQDDVAFYAQDDIHPIPQIHITPGVRVVGFSTSYSDQFQRDFTLLPGVVPATHCSLYQPADTGPQPNPLDPYSDIFGAPNATDQGSLCAEHASKSQVEPSINVGVMPFPWLTIYGGYDVTYRSPSLGGGGGPFLKVNPRFYQLAKGAYAQGGAKIHFNNAPVLGNFILGANYFHLDYTNQEIDYTLGNGEEVSAGGSSYYQGVDAFFDDDPKGNLHFFLNFSGEAANFTNYDTKGPGGICAPNVCFNNLPVSYVPNITLNTGVYYAIVNGNEHTLIEPHFWIEYTGSQHIFNNLTGTPDTRTMPSYTFANASVTVPFKHFNFEVDMLNLFNSKANTYEYVTSGGYFSDTPGSTNAYPGAPFTAYGTITYQF